MYMKQAKLLAVQSLNQQEIKKPPINEGDSRKCFRGYASQPHESPQDNILDGNRGAGDVGFSQQIRPQPNSGFAVVEFVSIQSAGVGDNPSVPMSNEPAIRLVAKLAGRDLNDRGCGHFLSQRLNQQVTESHVADDAA
jgi:hypothetical protein